MHCIKFFKKIALDVLILASILVGLICCSVQEESKQYVVMLSLDGFRWDYSEMVETPNFDKIAKLGVKAESLKPCFPSKTFPNHYSMATGLYPDNHGIVLNSFFDPESDRYYSIMDRESVGDGSFYGGEPIWNTAEKQGIKAGTYFWVGSEADIQNLHASYWMEYDHSFPFEQRIDSVIAWLNLPEEIRPKLVLWYLHEPDLVGHIYGPESKEVISEIVYLDSLLGVFMRKVEELPIAEDINFIVTSDHGMGNISDDRVVVLEENLNMDWIDNLQGYNPNFVIRAKEGYIDSIYLQLKQVQHISVWKSGELPNRLYYGTNSRTLDIVVVADSSWSLTLETKKDIGMGAHGFDNDNKDMHGIFYAYGPAFKKNYTSQTFDNIDIYPLICEILDIQPAEVDGNPEHIKGLLTK